MGLANGAVKLVELLVILSKVRRAVFLGLGSFATRPVAACQLQCNFIAAGAWSKLRPTGHGNMECLNFMACIYRTAAGEIASPSWLGLVIEAQKSKTTPS